MNIPQDAIEAATQALSIHWKAPHTNEALGRQRALAEHALTAALPALERQIRAQVAQEIWEARNRVVCANPPTPTDDALKTGYTFAYRIAQGRE